MDAKVAPFAHTIGPAQLGRLIEEAKARFDPEETEAERLAAAEARHFDIALADAGVTGRVRVDGDVDLADALDLEAAIAADAHHQLLVGSTDSLDVRRAIAAGNLARNQHTLDLPGRQPDAAPAASVRWCCTSTSNTPPSSAPAASPGSKRPGPGHRRTGPGVVRQPRHPDHRPAGPRPRRTPPRRLLRSLRPAQAPDPAPRPHLRVPVLLPPRRALRLRTPRPARPRPRRRRPDLHLQPRPLLPTPPPRQDHRRLDLPHRRTRGLPVAQPAGLPVPPRPHRHPRRHPRHRTPPTRPRVPHPLRRTLTTPPRTRSHHVSGEFGALSAAWSGGRRTREHRVPRHS